MKKHFLILLFALLFCSTMMAQPPGVKRFQLYDRDYKISIGPAVGFGFSTGSGSNAYDFNPSKGFAYHFGLAVNAHFGSRGRHSFGSGGTGLFGVEVEALYGRRNLKVSGSAAHLNCLEVPVLAQFYPLPNVGIEAGVTLVRFMGYSPDLTQAGTSFLHTGQISGGDVMPTFGVTYQLPIGLAFGARYQLGCSNLAGNLDSKVSAAMVSVSYLFNAVK